MAVSEALKRLFRIRVLEEEQGRLALEASLAELRHLESARADAFERNRRGRRLIESSVRQEEITDRQAGIEEIHIARRRTRLLSILIDKEEAAVEQKRTQFLLTRVHRRQAETLIEEAEAKQAAVTDRRNQQSMDDLYLNRLDKRKVDL